MDRGGRGIVMKMYECEVNQENGDVILTQKIDDTVQTIRLVPEQVPVLTSWIERVAISIEEQSTD